MLKLCNRATKLCCFYRYKGLFSASWTINQFGQSCYVCNHNIPSSTRIAISDTQAKPSSEYPAMMAPAVMYCHLLVWAHSSALCVWDLSKSSPLCSYKAVIVHTPIHLGGMLRPYLKAHCPILRFFLAKHRLFDKWQASATCCWEADTSLFTENREDTLSGVWQQVFAKKMQNSLKGFFFTRCQGSVLILLNKHYSMNLFHNTVFSYLCKAVNTINSFELYFSQSFHQSLWLHCNFGCEQAELGRGKEPAAVTECA